jgi:ABC-2 type transport system permease protein
VAAALPDTMLAFFGGGDMRTLEGFYQVETFGMMGPLVVMILTISIAQGALAGEESRRTMGLLLANPIGRSRVLAEKTVTMLVMGALVGLSTFAGVTAGALLADKGMDIGNIAATCVLMTLVGYVFGALALALGAATGKAKVAMFGAIGLAVFTHIMNSLGDLNADLGWLQTASPYHYYLGSDPLNNGMAWGDAAVLVALIAVFVGAAFVLFQRRDLRQSG